VSELLLEQVSPLGNVQAVVEADERTCYFYLYGSRECEFGVKSVWVRNLQAAPPELDVAGMKAGRPPMNPSAHCRSKTAAARPRAHDLRVCWLPEGNGAALFENGTMIAALPPWSGMSGFHGYSAECTGQSPLAWQMPDAPDLAQRFANAEEFWVAWKEDPWPGIREGVFSSVERALGPHSNYYAIDGGSWPPRGIVRVPTRGGVALVTVGMGILPQPNIEMYTDEPRDLRRVELGVLLPDSWNESEITRFGGYMSGQAQLPWAQFTWFGAGHTIPCNSWRNKRYTSALLVREHAAIPPIGLPPQFSDPVSILWFLPMDEAEREFAKQNGSAELLKKLPAERWRDA
jgi:hypothetical protein